MMIIFMIMSKDSDFYVDLSHCHYQYLVEVRAWSVVLLGMKLIKKNKKGAKVQQKIDPKHIHVPVQNAAQKDTSTMFCHLKRGSHFIHWINTYSRDGGKAISHWPKWLKLTLVSIAWRNQEYFGSSLEGMLVGHISAFLSVSLCAVIGQFCRP